MVPLPLQPKVVKKEGKNSAVFEIEALWPGYGVTIGNSLRRVLLSSLPGSAVTQVKIKGVQHEFSTLSGVLEDVVSIMLNLKQIRFKMYSDEPQKGILKVKGEKEARGRDFELPPQIELINKEALVATLTAKSAELEMEIQIEKGLGYQSKEARKKPREKSEIGVILLDAIFTPVRKVGFQVENMRVGERTDFDKLFLEVETDGSISPEEAFSRSCEVLVKHFQLLREPFEKTEPALPEIEEIKKLKKKAMGRKKIASGKKYDSRKRAPVIFSSGKKYEKTKKRKKTK